MREILFRGKRVDNGEWVEGYYVKFGNAHYILTSKIEVETHLNSYGLPCTSPKMHEVIPETVGQYVCITDKNGKKIFEGDVVKTKQGKIVNICFNDGAFCFNYNRYIYALGDSNYGYAYKATADELEVIGTVFDKESDNGD